MFRDLRLPRRTWEHIIAFLLALLLWQGVAMLVGAEILLPTPIAVVFRFFALLGEGMTWAAIGVSGGRILLGFFCGFAGGVLLAIPAARYPLCERLLFPYMITVRSVPVASFIVVALIWLSASQLSGFISFLIVLPIVYGNVLEGLSARDRALDEMATVYGMPFFPRLFYIWVPAIRPTLLAAATTSVGLAWKSGIAAELIGLVDGTIGDSLYLSKIHIDTPALFAWTLIIVIGSTVSEKLVRFLFRALLGGKRS